MTGHNEEQERDARLRAQLRDALPEPPLHEVDWMALRRQIAADAAPRLARFARSRVRGAWWEYAARWAGPALPAAFAAAAVLVLVLGRLIDTGTPATAATEAGGAAQTAGATTRVMLETALGASGASGTGAESTVMFASADDDALLRMAVTGQ